MLDIFDPYCGNCAASSLIIGELVKLGIRIGDINLSEICTKNTSRCYIYTITCMLCIDLAGSGFCYSTKYINY